MRMMLDIETLGTKPGSAILSIGAVVIKDDDSTGATFYQNISLLSSVFAGFVIDPETVKWWQEQSGDAQDVLCADNVPVDEALDNLSVFYQANGITRVWAKPPQFDCSLIEAAYDIVGRGPAPWGFRDLRDLRTLLDLAGPVQAPAFVGTPHNALDDALHQAHHMIEALKELKSAKR